MPTDFCFGSEKCTNKKPVKKACFEGVKFMKLVNVSLFCVPSAVVISLILAGITANCESCAERNFGDKAEIMHSMKTDVA